MLALASLATVLVLTPFSIKVAVRVGAVDRPGGRHIHDRVTPRFGGVAIFFAICLPLGAWFYLVDSGVIPPSCALPDSVDIYVLAAGVAVMFLTGVVDDVVGLPAKMKLLLQIVSASIVWLSGLELVDIKSYSGDVLISFGWASAPLTVFYLVAFANVVNLIDGLDGLAAGVCGIASLAILALSVRLSSWATGAVAVAVAATCLGFLRYNFHPAKTFMGDSGSLTLGLLVGIVSLMGTMRVSTLTSFVVPAIIAGVPVLDTFSAIVRRTCGHVPIDAPDRGHMHHRLLALGLGQRRVVLTMYALCAVFAASGVVISGSGFATRVVVVAVDLVLAAALVWRLRLFRPVLGGRYGKGRACANAADGEADADEGRDER